MTKGAIYDNFGDKGELVSSAYAFSCTQLLNKLIDAIAQVSSSTDELFAYTDFYIRSYNSLFQKGDCPLMNATIEADNRLHIL